jgi:hypothetical protein
LLNTEINNAQLSEIKYILQNHNTNDAISVTFESFSLTAASVTTIPIPAAIWLFGSAIVGFGVDEKRRSQKSSK